MTRRFREANRQNLVRVRPADGNPSARGHGDPSISQLFLELLLVSAHPGRDYAGAPADITLFAAVASGGCAGHCRSDSTFTRSDRTRRRPPSHEQSRGLRRRQGRYQGADEQAGLGRREPWARPRPPRLARLGHLRQEVPHRRLQRRHHALRARVDRRGQRRAGARPRVPGARQGQVPVDLVRGSVDPRGRHRRRGHGRPRGPVARRPHRQAPHRQQVRDPAQRPAARRRAGRLAHPRRVLPHGLRRQGDRRAVGGAHAGEVPHGPVWVRRALDVHAHQVLEPVLHPAQGERVDQEELERAGAVRGSLGVPHDAAHRPRPHPGRQVQAVGGQVRHGQAGLLRRLCRGVRQTDGAGLAGARQALSDRSRGCGGAGIFG